MQTPVFCFQAYHTNIFTSKSSVATGKMQEHPLKAKHTVTEQNLQIIKCQLGTGLGAVCVQTKYF